jgi:DNA-binding GntR family transcriptional regulator
MPDPIPLHSPSMHDNVAARLRQMVFDHALAPGSFVDEVALAQAWGISRTPIREALKVLAAEGLVEPVPRRGSRVTAMTDADAEQLFPVMALLEGRCAHEAVARATPDDTAELRRLHETLERHAAKHDLDGYYRANHVFHSRVQQLAGNRWLDRATDDLRRFMRLWRGRQLALPGRIDASINEHRVLIDAITQGDAERAERAMHDHLMAQLAALKRLQKLERSGAARANATAASRAPTTGTPRGTTAARRGSRGGTTAGTTPSTTPSTTPGTTTGTSRTLELPTTLTTPRGTTVDARTSPRRKPHGR